uniref:Uncharacterized protein n=1 Tax=Hucho hucho TaxID=62062 RepID=A0A4W5QQX6_9TELE
MMERAAVLVLCCLVPSVSGSSLWPSIRYWEKPNILHNSNFISNPKKQLQGTAKQCQEAEVQFPLRTQFGNLM